LYNTNVSFHIDIFKKKIKMNYSLNSFFPNNNSTIHILQNKNDEQTPLCLVVNKKWSQQFQIFNLKEFLKELINNNHPKFIGLSLQNIETIYQVGEKKYDLDENQLEKCCRDHGYEIKDLLCGGLIGIGTYGNVYLIAKERTSNEDRIVKLYITKKKKLEKVDPKWIYGKYIIEGEFIDQEQKMSILAYHESIGPEIFKTWICSINQTIQKKGQATEVKIINLSFIVMEKYDITFHSYSGKIINAFYEAEDKTKKYFKIEKLTKDQMTYLSVLYNLSDEIIQGIYDLLNKMRKLKFQHNDAHSENIMLKGNEVRFIDFGKSESWQQKPENFNYNKDVNSLYAYYSAFHGEIPKMIYGKFVEGLLKLEGEGEGEEEEEEEKKGEKRKKRKTIIKLKTLNLLS